MIVIGPEPAGIGLLDAPGAPALLIAAAILAVSGALAFFVKIPGGRAQPQPTEDSGLDFLLASDASEAPRQPARPIPKAVPITALSMAALALAASAVSWSAAAGNPAEAWRDGARAQIDQLAGAPVDDDSLDSILACGVDAVRCGGFLVGDSVLEASQLPGSSVQVEMLGTGRIGTGLDGSPAIILDSKGDRTGTAIPSASPEPSASPQATATPTATATAAATQTPAPTQTPTPTP